MGGRNEDGEMDTMKSNNLRLADAGFILLILLMLCTPTAFGFLHHAQIRVINENRLHTAFPEGSITYMPRR